MHGGGERGGNEVLIKEAMNTVLTAEQKARKNELARLRRLKKKETPSLPNLDGYKTDSDNAEEEEVRRKGAASMARVRV